MNQSATQQLIETKASEPIQFAPLNLIRTETVLSRLPIHNLAKKGRVDIRITKKNEQGEVELYWRVSPNSDFGEPRQLAYKLDTVVINRKIDELPRPLPKIIRLDNLDQIRKNLEVTHGGSGHLSVKNAFLQNAFTGITAKLRYKANDGTEKTLEAGFTRYSVIFTGERLPDGRKADAVYLVLNDIYLDVLNNAPTRPLNYDYLKVLTPSAQRFYEIISYKIFAALKNKHPHAKMLYSEYCTFAAQQRYFDYDHFKKQMYKVHKPHKASGYLEKVWYEPVTDQDNNLDWMMYYIPGPKAQAEYQTCNGKKHVTEVPTQSETLLTFPTTTEEPLQSRGQGSDQPPPQPEDPLATQAQELVQYFHKRFHQVATSTPASKELTHATTLIAQYSMDQARHIVDFAHQSAQETHFKPAAFGAILQYASRAIADYEHAKQREQAAARAREAQRRAQDDEQLKRQYENYRREQLAHLRATLPPDQLTAIEQSVKSQFDQEDTNPFGREFTLRLKTDDALAAQFHIPTFDDWSRGEETTEAPIAHSA